MKKLLLLALLPLCVAAADEVPDTKQLVVQITLCGETVYLFNILHDNQSKGSILYHGDIKKMASTPNAKRMLEYSFDHPATTYREDEISKIAGVQCS